MDLLRCPMTGEALVRSGDELRAEGGVRCYAISESGIPLFAEQACSAEARAQQTHYDRIARAYSENLSYPHTREYMAYLDDAFLTRVERATLGTAAELCCGHGEAFRLLGESVVRGIGVDVSLAMLDVALRRAPRDGISFVQADATRLPLAPGSFDSVLMLGGIHHVSDRRRLFSEVARILKPGGRFYFREPVSDFFLWRLIRGVVYRLSPALDAATERPLLFDETVPVLAEVGLDCEHWSTHGFLGFCLFMNSDVLVFNRLFRFVPGIEALTRFAARADDRTLRLPALERAGLQVVGVARKRALAPSP